MVVGINRYTGRGPTGKIPDLDGCINDANDIARQVARLDSNVRVLGVRNEPVTRDTFFSAWKSMLSAARTGDTLLLSRFADHASAAVWRLSEARCLAALEEGISLDELEQFLRTRGDSSLPHTVEVFLADLRERAARLRDLGAARARSGTAGNPPAVQALLTATAAGRTDTTARRRRVRRNNGRSGT